jgi:hypothetical protein
MLSARTQLTDREKRLLDDAEQYARDLRLADLTSEAMCELSRERGIDFATAVLYCLYGRHAHPDHQEEQPDANHQDRSQELQIAIVPGAFYKEHPQTGADGGRLRQAAAVMGLDCHLIQVESIGLLQSNSQIIIDWLLEHATRPTVLVSFCKGGADLKMALGHPLAAEAFANVGSWYSVCGILDGSPMVDWIYERPTMLLAARALFWFRRRNFQFVTQLRTGPTSPLHASFTTPDHLQVFHVVGFPLTTHLSNGRSRTWHRRLSRFGPSDGATLLLDVCRQPGRVLPLWGVDHYAAARVDWTALVRDIALRVASTPGESLGSKVAPLGRLAASTPK